MEILVMLSVVFVGAAMAVSTKSAWHWRLGHLDGYPNDPVDKHMIKHRFYTRLWRGLFGFGACLGVAAILIGR